MCYETTKGIYLEKGKMQEVHLSFQHFLDTHPNTKTAYHALIKSSANG